MLAVVAVMSARAEIPADPAQVHPLPVGARRPMFRGSHRGRQGALLHPRWLSTAHYRHFLPRWMVPLLQMQLTLTAIGGTKTARAGL